MPALLTAYQHIMPLLYIAWGMVCMQWLVVRKRELGIGLVASVREAYVVRSVGSSLWWRVYRSVMF